jgi:serine/threonine protein kinase
VFALGVIAYQLLTGKLPFDSGILAVVDDGTMQHVPTEILAPDLAPELARLVDSMLAYDRWDRPSASEVHAELAWLSGVLATPVRKRQPLRIRRPRWTPALQFNRTHDRARTDPDFLPAGLDDDSNQRE